MTRRIRRRRCACATDTRCVYGITTRECSAFTHSLTQFFLFHPQIPFIDSPASHRAPPEIWDRIASFIPRYHLRTWLFVSPFHREIAVRRIFRTLDLYFGEDTDNLTRGLDILERVKTDRVFGGRVRTLRLHWAYEDGDMLDLMKSE